MASVAAAFLLFEHSTKYLKSTALRGKEFQNDNTLLGHTPGGGSTWPTNIRGRAAGKSKKLPCPGVKFPKMIPCLGVKFS